MVHLAVATIIAASGLLFFCFSAVMESVANHQAAVDVDFSNLKI